MLNSNYFYKVDETKGKNDEIPMELDVQTNIQPRIEKKFNQIKLSERTRDSLHLIIPGNSHCPR